MTEKKIPNVLTNDSAMLKTFQPKAMFIAPEVDFRGSAQPKVEPFKNIAAAPNQPPPPPPPAKDD